MGVDPLKCHLADQYVRQHLLAVELHTCVWVGRIRKRSVPALDRFTFIGLPHHVEHLT